MADQTNQQQLGLLRELSVRMINADGSRMVDITRLIRQMSITEDIFKNSMYGSVRIKDAIDLLGGKFGLNNAAKMKNVKGFPIIGEEFLEIRYTTDFTGKSVSLRFAVYAISDIVYSKNNTIKQYTLDFCSEEHLLDATTVIMKKYSEQHSSNVKSICRDYLNLDDGSGTTGVSQNNAAPPAANTAPANQGKAPGTPASNTQPTTGATPTVTQATTPTGGLAYPTTGEKAYFKNKKKLVTIQPTKGPQDVIIPRLSPFQAVELIARRSIAEDDKFQSASFLFFENFDGYNFCDVEYLITRGIQTASQDEDKYTYYHENPLIRDSSPKQPRKGSNPVSPYREYKTIHKIEHLHYFDTIEKLKMGMFESDVIVFDYTNHDFFNSRFKFLNNDKGDNSRSVTLGNFENKSYPENSSSFMKKVTSQTDQDQRYTRKFFIPKDMSDPNKDTYLEIIYPNRASYFTRLAQDVFSLHTYGDPEIKAGDVILLNIPEGDGSDQSKSGSVNPYLSGTFLVGTIRHVFTQTAYQTIMDVYKNAFGAPVISTDEAESNKPTPNTGDGPQIRPPAKDLASAPPADPSANPKTTPKPGSAPGTKK